MSDQPIDNITWRDATALHANHWNPNRVMTPELLLLERSLLTLGWIQPILINPAGMIIDGFHRWRISQDSPKIVDRFARLVPVAILEVDDPTAMAITVRINRAKGHHTGQGMSELCRTIVNVYGWSVADLAREIGADEVEMAHLMLADVFEMKRIDEHGYSPAWYPTGTPAELRAEGGPTDGRDEDADD